MSYFLLCFILGLCLYHLYLSRSVSNYQKNKNTENISLLLNKFVLVAPALALIIFSVLLNTILKGRFVERSSHALILFFLWLLLTRIYIFFISLKPQKYTLFRLIVTGVLILSLIILLTPLDRYVSSLFNQFKNWTYLIGVLECFVFYAGYSFKKNG